MSPRMNRTTDSGRMFRCCLVVWYLLASLQSAAYALDPARWKRVDVQRAEKANPTPARESVDQAKVVGRPVGNSIAVPHGAQSDEKGKASEDGRVRLYYVSATWSHILQDVATKTGSTLVMHDVPPGRWSRQGLEKLNRTEAVAVLNRELEPLGYRILEKGEFLTVIEMGRARTEYRRPVYPQERAKNQLVSAVPKEDPSPGPQRRFDSITPAAAPVAARTQGTGIAQVSAAERAGQSGRSIVQAQFAENQPPADPAPPAAQAQPATPVPANPIEEKSVSVTPTKRTAVDIARQIYKTFESRSELIDAGPKGLPGIRVYHPAPAEEKATTLRGPLWFTLEIDTEKNSLWVTGDARTAASVPVLIGRLDQTPAAGESTKIMAGEGNLKGVADKLKPELDRIVQNRQGQNPAAAVRNPLDSNAPEAPAPMPIDPKAPEAPANGLAGDVQQLLGNLKGEVIVESVGDLDVLVIRGNEKDVEAVMNVIQAIERMAQGTTPGIHVQFLNHVDSESLAALLTEVYEKLTTIKQGSTSSTQQSKTVNVVAVSKPNAVLVIAPPILLEGVVQLIEELDQPVDPATEVEIFRLKHAIASQVVTLIESHYEERVGLGTKIAVTADARTNSVIVQAKPNELSEITLLIKKIDRADSNAVSRIHRIKLNYAVADELAAFLQNALQQAISPPSQITTQQGGQFGQGGGQGGANQAPQELRDSKSVVLEFLAKSDATEKLVRSGLLSDIRFNPDVRTNTLIVTAPQPSIPFIEELVAILDQPAAQVAEIKVFTLKNSDAASAVELLTSIFSSNQQQGNQNQQNQGVGLQIAGAEDPSSTLIPLKFGTDARTNSVIAVGGAEALRIVESILLRLDLSDIRNRKSTVYKLRNSPASQVALAINQFLQSQRDLAQLDPGRISTSEILEQEVIVTAESVTNSLLISATPRYYDDIMRIARDLDQEPAQVIMQALLVEVELENTDEFGVELGFQDRILFRRSAIDNIQLLESTSTAPNGVQTTTQQIISQAATPGFLFNNQPLGNNPSNGSGRVGTQGLSNFAVGRTNSDLGFGGLVLSASSEAVSVLIRALAAKRNVRVLSRPQVLAVDNQLAQIQVGQQVPIVTGFQTNALGTANPTVTQDNAGIILTVTPRISPEGQIVMEVAAEKSAFQTGAAGVPIYVDPTTGNTITSPIKDITTARTTVKVPDGQTIVVGGMITSSEEVVSRKVPWLADVPILGQAFRYDFVNNRRTELLIFLTPRIIHCSEDMEFIKQVEAERLHFLVDEAEAIQGPLFTTPAETFGPIDPTMEFQQAPMPVPAPPAGFPDDAHIPVEPRPIPRPQSVYPARPTPTPPNPEGPGIGVIE
ncbi:Putative type II secretion system protein D precursor [Planctomyces sp. SH-PL14]|nr:Putative type II secretion system protein D precursor [Planctomyces sp. SH-PL14]